MLNATIKQNISFSKEYPLHLNHGKIKLNSLKQNSLKQNISNVLSVLDPKNSKIQRLISRSPISRDTTERRIFEISDGVEQQLLNDLKNCEVISLTLD